MLTASRQGSKCVCNRNTLSFSPLYRHRSFVGGFSCRRFTVLALESSADDTCAAVVTSDRKILANVVISQHEQYVIQPLNSAMTCCPALTQS